MKFEIQLQFETDGMDGPKDLDGITQDLVKEFLNIARPYVNLTGPSIARWATKQTNKKKMGKWLPINKNAKA